MNYYRLMKTLALIILVFSCASLLEGKLLSKWQGKFLSELKTHPYFSTLPSQAKEGVREYRYISRFRSKASCQALGGCIGLGDYNCTYRFILDKERIKEARQLGQCPGENTDPK